VDYQPYATENGPTQMPTANQDIPAGTLYTDLSVSTLAQGTTPGYRRVSSEDDWTTIAYNDYYGAGGNLGWDNWIQFEMPKMLEGGNNEASPGEWELESDHTAAKAQQKMRDTRLGIKRDTNGRVITGASAGAGFLGTGDIIQSKNIGRTVKLGDFEMVVDGNTPAEEWETEYGGVVGDVAGFVRFMHNMRPGAIKDRENIQAAVGGWLSSMGSAVTGWLPKASGSPVQGGNGASWLSDQMNMGNGGEGVTFGKPGTVVYRSTEDGGSYVRP